MTRKKQIAAESPSTEALPNQITVVGHGVPASFELTVDGELAAVDADASEPVSNHAVEGAIASGTVQFRFSGELANAHLLDADSTAGDASSAPTIHVEYGTR